MPTRWTSDEVSPSESLRILSPPRGRSGYVRYVVALAGGGTLVTQPPPLALVGNGGGPAADEHPSALATVEESSPCKPSALTRAIRFAD